MPLANLAVFGFESNRLISSNSEHLLPKYSSGTCIF